MYYEVRLKRAESKKIEVFQLTACNSNSIILTVETMVPDNTMFSVIKLQEDSSLDIVENI